MFQAQPVIYLNRKHKLYSIEHEILCTLSTTGVSMNALVDDFALKDQKQLRKILQTLNEQGYRTTTHNIKHSGRQVILNRSDASAAKLKAQLYWQQVNKPKVIAA